MDTHELPTNSSRGRNLHKYCVVLRGRPAIRLNETIEVRFNQQDTESLLRLSDSWTTAFPRVHQGLQAEIELWAPSLKEAVKEGNGKTEFVLTLLSFSTWAESEPLFPHVAYDITPGITKREFIQFIHNIGLPIKAERDLEVPCFLRLLQAVERNASDRIARAMRWFRKSLLVEPDPFDEFICLWSGLECLNSPLQKLWGVPSELRKCRKCGYQMQIPSAVGIKELLTQHYPGSIDFYRDVRAIRAQLLHGFGDLGELRQRIESVIPQLRNALAKAILELLQIPEDEHSCWLRQPLTNRPPLWFEVRGFLHESKVENLRVDGQHPEFAVQFEVRGVSQTEQGKTKLGFRTILRKKFPYKFTPVCVEAMGPKEGYEIEFR